MGRIQIFYGLVLVVWCVWAAPAAHAADPAILAAESSVRLGISAGYGQYQMSSAPQLNGTGGLVGGTLAASALTPRHIGDVYADVEYDFSKGFLNDSGQVAQQHASDAYNTVIVRLGLGVPLLGGREIIPYVAGGYQNWNHDVRAPHGMGAYYQAGLIGGGVRFDLTAGPAFVVSASVEGLAVTGGSVTVPSAHISGQLGTSAQERVSLDADYQLSSAWHAFAGLGVTHYSYTGSRPGSFGMFEPSSGTLQVSSTFGVAYGF
jgi:opacity protein-like surface antigen